MGITTLRTIVSARKVGKKKRKKDNRYNYSLLSAALPEEGEADMQHIKGPRDLCGKRLCKLSFTNTNALPRKDASIFFFTKLSHEQQKRRKILVEITDHRVGTELNGKATLSFSSSRHKKR